MKKIVLFLLALFSLPIAVQAQVLEDQTTVSLKQEVIRNFEVTADLTADRNFIITENIEYDFGQAEKHGIYRYITESYIRDGYNYSLHYEILSVSRDGQAEKYEKSRQGNNLMLKIGRAETTITGKHVYSIRYKTRQAINFFDDGHSELYWNVTGNEWPVKIENSSFQLKSPLGDQDQDLMFACFTGPFGSTQAECQLSPANGGLNVSSDKILDKQEGLTVVFGFPPGMIAKETTSQMLLRILWDNIILLAPLLALLAMFYLWFTKGKDPEPEIVIPEYDTPRGFSPLVLSGTLGNGAIPSRGITATIIDMARKNYLHIEYKIKKGLFSDKNEYAFIQKNKPSEKALAWEQILWDGLFNHGKRQKSTINDLKVNDFYKDVQLATGKASKVLNQEHIFASNPYVVRSLYLIAAILGFVIVRVVAGMAPVGTLAAFATGIIIAVFGWFMPKRTLEGTELVAKVKGFKGFLSVTEAERLKFHNAPARTPEQFMEFLPAAIALGVEKEWAEQFKDLQMHPPEWAEGDISSLTAVGLASAMSSMHTQTAETAYSPPSSSGSGGSGFSGGGSGGGGGGGGGGSW